MQRLFRSHSFHVDSWEQVKNNNAMVIYHGYLCEERLAYYWFSSSQTERAAKKKSQNISAATDWSLYRYKGAAVYMAHCQCCSITSSN